MMPGFLLQYGTTPLIWACRKGYLEIVEALVNEGANTDVVGMVIKILKFDPFTVLTWG